MKRFNKNRPAGNAQTRLLHIVSFLFAVAGTAHPQLSTAQSAGDRPVTRVIAADSLAEPWIDSSSGATVDYTNTEQVYSGTTSIKATLDAGGKLEVHSGQWGNRIGQDLIPFDTLGLRLWLDSPGPVRVELGSEDPGVSFSPVSLDSLPAGQWTRVQVALAALDGAGKTADQVRLVNPGAAAQTLWVDDWRLSGDGGPPTRGVAAEGLVAPWLDHPMGGTVDYANTERAWEGAVSIKAVLDWLTGVRVYAGPFGYPSHPEITPFDSLRLRIWPDSDGQILVGFLSGSGGNFPQVPLDGLPVGQWSEVALPLEQLSPDGDRPEQIFIMNNATVSRTFWFDNWALSRPAPPPIPNLSVSHPPGGYRTDSASVQITGTVTDTTDSVSLTINEEPVALSPDGTFSHEVGLFPGDNYFRLEAVNANDDEASASVTVTRNYITAIPPDPETVAPPLDSTVITTLYHSTEFLFQGDSLIQYGVEEATIEPRRAGVIRGKVLDRAGSPLSGVLITVLDHPEYGYTFTRTGGNFDMAVNGGGVLTLNYEKEDYLPVQRQVEVPWQDYVAVDSVMMVQLDPSVTTIDFSDTTEVARGSVVTDEDGSRQGTLMFARGTTAEMVMPDGFTQPLDSLRVRATEYTVGENGPASMPAILPPTSGYTYAAELSADQALQAGATEVRFDKPVAYYVENFIGFPVGTAVPAGYYDRRQGKWIASENGRVIEIIGITDGLAELDISGDGAADPADSLAALGIDDSERQELASLYSAGQSLWRTEITHFSSVDHNWPFGPPEDAEYPMVKQKEPPPTENDQSDCKAGSVISVQNQTLGEAVDLVGAPCGLHYNSAATRGFEAPHILPVALSGSSVPGSLQQITLRIEIAGSTFDTAFAPGPDLTYTFRWDGRDAYGRPVQGARTAEVHIGYVYQTVYYEPQDLTRSFARIGLRPTAAFRRAVKISLDQSWSATLKRFVRTDFGGWHPGIHHQYDMIGGTLYEGTGAIREVQNSDHIVRVEVDETEWNSENVVVRDIAAGPDGSTYINTTENFHSKIVRKKPGGTLETVFEIRYCTPQLNPNNCITIRSIDVTPEGEIYIADNIFRKNINDDVPQSRIYKIDEFGQLKLIAGNLECGYSGDGGPAVSAELCRPTDIVAADDGSVYIADQFGKVVRKIGADGIITTVAGTGAYGFNGDQPLPADQVEFMYIQSMDIGYDGSLYLADTDQNRIRKVSPEGMVTTVAGTGRTGINHNEQVPDERGDGGPATSARLLAPSDVAVAPDGSLFIADNYAHHIRKVTPDGLIYRLAGLYGENPYLFWGRSSDYFGGFNFNGGPASATRLSLPERVALGPDGNLYFTERDKDYVRMVESKADHVSDSEIIIASSGGRRLYGFDASGKHQSTRDALTGTTLFSFVYDSAGRLSKITDIDGLATTIERDSAGVPQAFVAPFGQRTQLSMGPGGRLASVENPEGETTRFAYTEGGLLTQMRDPKNNLTRYAYDSLGYFQRADYPNGGFTELSKAETPDGFEVTMTTAEGSTQQYQVEQLADGTSIYTHTDAHGLQTTRRYGGDGSVTVTAPDSTTTLTRTRPDPRFGMQVPLVDTLWVATPSGLQSIFSQRRTITQMTGDEVTGITDSLITNGRVTTSVWDGNQRRATTTSPEGRQSFSHTDSLGRVIQSSVPGIEPVNYTYNSNGFLIETEQGGRITEFTYNARGWLETATDPLGRTDSTRYDSVGRVTRQILPGGEEILYEYDANGNLTTITPPGQPAHTFSYTEVDLTDSYTPPAVPDSAGGIAYLYDLDQKLLSTVFSDSTSIGIVYDTTVTGSTRPIAITYDQGSTSFAYDSTTGNLTSVVSSDSVVTNYSYDGPLTTQLATQGVVNGIIDYSYNNDFRVTSQSINSADTIGFTYDDDGLLIGAGELSMSYDPQNGLLTADTLGNITGSYSYNPFGELSGKNLQHVGTDLYNRSFTRDSLGRITSITEIIEGDTTLYEYAYNEIGYLVQVKENGVVTAEYKYDANGNRTAYITPTDTLTATYDDQDRMLSYGDASYSYGKRGELQRKIVGTDTTTYNYDNLGNLRFVTMPNGTLIEYIIDGLDRRVAKKVNGAIVKRWIYQDQLNPIAELDSSGNVTARFVYGSKRNVPEYIVKNDTTYRVISDHLGSVRLIVNTQTGHIAQRMDYDDYGNVLSNTNPGFQPFGYAGGLYDGETGLVRFGSRDYDPQTGRWTAKDPIGFGGGASNLYEYVFNDPVNDIDPEGLQSTVVPANSSNSPCDYENPNLSVAGNYAAGISYVSGATARRIGSILKNRGAYGSLLPITILRTPGIHYAVPVKTSVFKAIGTGAKALGYAAGFAGLTITGYQYATGEISGVEASFDAAFGAASFAWPIGTAASIGYFGGKAIHAYFFD